MSACCLCLALPLSWEWPSTLSPPNPLFKRSHIKFTVKEGRWEGPSNKSSFKLQGHTSRDSKPDTVWWHNADKWLGEGEGPSSSLHNSYSAPGAPAWPIPTLPTPTLTERHRERKDMDNPSPSLSYQGNFRWSLPPLKQNKHYQIPSFTNSMGLTGLFGQLI